MCVFPPSKSIRLSLLLRRPPWADQMFTMKSEAKNRMLLPPLARQDHMSGLSFTFGRFYRMALCACQLRVEYARPMLSLQSYVIGALVSSKFLYDTLTTIHLFLIHSIFPTTESDKKTLLWDSRAESANSIQKPPLRRAIFTSTHPLLTLNTSTSPWASSTQYGEQ